MKSLVLFLFCIATNCGLLAQQSIGDSNMADAIRWACPTCIDSSNRLTANAATIRSITLSNNISDLTGITGFSNLISLNVADNNLTFLPTLPPGLTTFRCSNNRLTQLPTLPSGLTVFHCYGNKLTQLPTLPVNLKVFDCSRNQISALPTLPATLESFYCSYNNLNGLPFLPNTLTDFGCANNNLTSLPPLPPNLTLVSCFNNPSLKCLPKLPQFLKYLEISAPINCLPNSVVGLTILRYDATLFNTILLPVCTNSCGATNGVNDVLSAKIRIFPTITEGGLRIESDGLTIDEVVIFDNTGREMMRTKALSLDISSFISGVYFVEIQIQEERVLKKVVKL